MQAIVGIRDGGSGAPRHGGGFAGHGHKYGNKAKGQEGASSARKRNGFLTERLLPVSGGLKMDVDGRKVDVATMDNLEYLYASARNYVALLGTRLRFNTKRYAANPRLGIAELYKTFDAVVPEYVNIENDGGRLVFCLYRFHDWPDHTLLWLPLDFTGRLSYGVRRVAREFIRRFAAHHCLSDITSSYYYGIAEDWLMCGDECLECNTGAEVRQALRLFGSYNCGRISRMFRRMRGRAFCRLETELGSCRPANGAEAELLDIIRDGTGLIGKGRPCIFDYEYDWAKEECPDIMPAGLESQIMLVYSVDDMVAENVRQMFCSEMQEVYNLTPVTAWAVTPETVTAFTMDDYPERFSEWFNRLVYHVSENFKPKKQPL